jgi:hypothetical protein
VNDEPSARAVVAKGLFERWPRVPTVWANRVVERFDNDRVRVNSDIFVDEPVDLRRWQGLGLNIDSKDKECEEQEQTRW